MRKRNVEGRNDEFYNYPQHAGHNNNQHVSQSAEKLTECSHLLAGRYMYMFITNNCISIPYQYVRFQPATLKLTPVM